jgi:hypothetical protein
MLSRSTWNPKKKAVMPSRRPHHLVIWLAGAMTRSYDLDGFAPAFEIVDGARRQSAAP